MCYSPNDRPPDPPGKPGAATGEDLILTAADGTEFTAYLAHPSSSEGASSKASVLIYPDVRGLHDFYKHLALRFAEQGYHALAIDYFGRTAGIDTPRDDSFEFMPHVGQITFPTFLADVTAALAYLNEHTNPQSAIRNPQSVFTVGFCMGGALSLLTAAEPLPLAGAIAFYSGFGRKFPGTDLTTLEQSANTRIPVLGLYGGADQGIPQSQIEELDRNLDTANVEHELIIYPGAPHSFFDRKATDFAEASTDAWHRVLRFISTHSS